MNKQELLDLGYTEEQAKQIMGLHGKVMTKLNKQIEQLESTVENQEAEITKRDKDLKQLKRDNADNEEVASELAALQTKYKELKASKQTEAKENAINLAILDAKGKNVKAILPFLDQEKISFDGKTLTGLTEQLDSLVKEESWLFEGGEYKPSKNKTVPLADLNNIGKEGFSIDEYIKQQQGGL